MPADRVLHTFPEGIPTSVMTVGSLVVNRRDPQQCVLVPAPGTMDKLVIHKSRDSHVHQSFRLSQGHDTSVDFTTFVTGRYTSDGFEKEYVQAPVRQTLALGQWEAALKMIAGTEDGRKWIDDRVRHSHSIYLVTKIQILEGATASQAQGNTRAMSVKVKVPVEEVGSHGATNALGAARSTPGVLDPAMKYAEHRTANRTMAYSTKEERIFAADFQKVTVQSGEATLRKIPWWRSLCCCCCADARQPIDAQETSTAKVTIVDDTEKPGGDDVVDDPGVVEIGGNKYFLPEGYLLVYDPQYLKSNSSVNVQHVAKSTSSRNTPNDGMDDRSLSNGEPRPKEGQPDATEYNDIGERRGDRYNHLNDTSEFGSTKHDLGGTPESGDGRPGGDGIVSDADDDDRQNAGSSTGRLRGELEEGANDGGLADEGSDEGKIGGEDDDGEQYQTGTDPEEGREETERRGDGETLEDGEKVEDGEGSQSAEGGEEMKGEGDEDKEQTSPPGNAAGSALPQPDAQVQSSESNHESSDLDDEANDSERSGMTR